MWKLIISILLIIVPTTVFGYFGKPVEMGIMLFAGFTCAIFINLDRFSSFRAGELEAKINDAKQVIDEAHVTLDNLKNMTEPLMNYLLAHIVRGDRIAGVDARDKEVLYNRIKENINQFNIESEYSQELISQAKFKIIKTFLWEIEFEVERKVGWEKAEPIRKFIHLKFKEDANNYPDVTEVRDLINSNSDLYDEGVEKKIREYERAVNELM